MANQVMRITLKAYDHQLVDASAAKIIDTVKKNGATVSGPVPLPTKKEVVTILRAVHKYKDSREQFEQRTHKRLIDIIAPTQKTVEDVYKRQDILLQALLAAAQTAEGRDMAYELDMKSWLFTAWGSLYKKFAQPRPECKNAVIRERLKLNRMTGYLTEHCNEKLTLSAMAEACQVSTGDFCRFFKKHMEMLSLIHI